jgi:hypothetical protein
VAQRLATSRPSWRRLRPCTPRLRTVSGRLRSIFTWLGDAQKLGEPPRLSQPGLGGIGHGSLGASRLRETAIRGDRRLTIHRKVRASAFQQAIARDDDDGKERFTYEEVTVGTLAGPAFFDSLDTYRAVASAIQSVKGHAYEKALALDMKKRRKAVERSFEDLKRCAEIYHDVDAFLSPDSFAILARWADQNDGISRKLVTRPNGLFFNDNLNQGITLLPVPDLDESLLDCIWEYRRAG